MSLFEAARHNRAHSACEWIGRVLPRSAVDAGQWQWGSKERDKYLISITNQEVYRAIMLDAPRNGARAWMFVRRIKNIDVASAVASQYIDIDHDHEVARESQELLHRLLEKAPDMFPPLNTYSFDVEWDSAGITLATHSNHILNICGCIQASLERAILDVAEAAAQRHYDLVCNGLDVHIDRIIAGTMREVSQHATFTASRSNTFFGRDHELRNIVEYAMNCTVVEDCSWTPLVLVGESGVGKTSLMATGAKRVRAAMDKSHFPNAVVITRYCGTTPETSECRRLVRSLCLQLYLVCKLQHEDDAIDAVLPPTTVLALDGMGLKALTTVFHAVLAAVASQRQPVVLFLDALDQLQNDENGRSELFWLPAKLPRFVGVVVSTLPDVGGCFMALVRRGFADRATLARLAVESPAPAGQNYQEEISHAREGLSGKTSLVTLPSAAKTMAVPRMEESEIDRVLSGLLNGIHRTLTPAQWDVVVRSISHCTLPLYIQLTFGACSRWKSTQPLPCQQFPTSVQGMVSDFYDSLVIHGPHLVQWSVALLAASQEGLTETELLDVLSCCDDVMDELQAKHTPPRRRLPPLIWSRLREDFLGYLVLRGSAGGLPVLKFFHRQFWEVAEAKFLGKKVHRVATARLLARYFSGTLEDTSRGIPVNGTWCNGKPNLRKLAELPQALITAEMWPELVQTLTNVDFFVAKCLTMLRSLVQDVLDAVGAAARSDATTRHSVQALVPYLVFLRVEATVLHRRPYLVVQQAMNSSADSPVRQRVQDAVRRGGLLASAALQDSRHAYLARLLNVQQTAGPNIFTVDVDAADWVTRFAMHVASRTIVVVALDGNIRLYDANTGAQTLTIFDHHRIPVACLEICETLEILVTGAHDGTVRAFNVRSGVSVMTHHTTSADTTPSVPPSPADEISQSCRDLYHFQYSPNAVTALSASEKDNLVCYSAMHDTTINVCKLVPTSMGQFSLIDLFAIPYASEHILITKLAFASTAPRSDSVHLLATTVTGCTRSMQINMGSEHTYQTTWEATCHTHPLALTSVHGTNNASIPTSAAFPVTPFTINDASYSPDGLAVAIAGGGMVLRVLRVADGTEITALPHPSDVRACAYSPDGQHLGSAGGDLAIRLWNTQTYSLERVLKGHTAAATSMCFPSNTRVFTGGIDMTIRLWDLTVPSSDHTDPWCVDGVVSALAMSPDASACLVACSVLTIYRKDPATSTTWRPEVLRYQAERGCVYDVAWAPSGVHWVSCFYSASGAHELAVCAADTAAVVLRLGTPTHGALCCRYSRDGAHIASAGASHDVRLWHAQTGVCTHVLHGHTGSVRGLSFSPDSTMLASCGMGCNTLRIWNLTDTNDTSLSKRSVEGVDCSTLPTEDSTEMPTHVTSEGPPTDSASPRVIHASCVGQGHTTQVRGCAWSPRGRAVLTASLDRTLRVWDINGNVETANATLAAPSVHSDTPQGVAQQLSAQISAAQAQASAGAIGTMGAPAEMHANGMEQQQCREMVASHCLTNHQHIVWQCKFSPCGTRAASVSEDGHCILYDVDTWAEVACFAPGVGMRSIVFESSSVLWAGASDGRIFRVCLEDSGTTFRQGG
eukprot:m.1439093 g.1439093  ORF g.1439093 m.1439093 type:complete len:1588 (+) comp25093_c0_seq23:2068-6831(+)